MITKTTGQVANKAVINSNMNDLPVFLMGLNHQSFLLLLFAYVLNKTSSTKELSVPLQE